MMDKFKKVGDSITKKVDIEQLKHKRAQSEKYFLQVFTEVDKEVFTELQALNESPQLNYAIALAEAFRNMCEKIGDDPTFRGMMKFLTFVRTRDRNMEKTIDWYKQKFEFKNPEKFRIDGGSRDDRYQSLVGRFFQAVTSYLNDMKADEEDRKRNMQQRQLEKQKTIEEKKLAKLDLTRSENSSEDKQKDGDLQDQVSPIKKIKQTLEEKLHPERLPENQERIKEFRNNMTEEQTEKIQKPMAIKKEISIFEEFASEFIENLYQLESLGWYNHIKSYSKAWLQFLEDTINNTIALQKMDIKSAFRSRFIEIEKWAERIEVKYSILENRNPKEPEIEENEINDRLKQYEISRQNAITQEEDERIWDFLKDEVGLQSKEEKIKQDEETKKQKEIEREEKAKNKAEEKGKLLEEKQRQKEEREKQKAEEMARKAEEEALKQQEKEKRQAEETAKKAEEEAIKQQEKEKREAEEAERKAQEEALKQQQIEEEKVNEAKKIAEEAEQLKKFNEQKAEKENVEPEQTENESNQDQAQESTDINNATTEEPVVEKMPKVKEKKGKAAKKKSSKKNQAQLKETNESTEVHPENDSSESSSGPEDESTSE